MRFPRLIVVKNLEVKRLVVKNPPAHIGDTRNTGLISELGRSPGGGHGNPLQYSCLENPRDRRAWWAAVHQVPQSWTWLKWFSSSSSSSSVTIHVIFSVMWTYLNFSWLMWMSSWSGWPSDPAAPKTISIKSHALKSFFLKNTCLCLT